MRKLTLIACLLATAAMAQDKPDETKAKDTAPAAQTKSDVKTMSGMSILGNEEAPKALVIVPWKSSKLGDSLGVAESLDDSPRPVDKKVFMRELHYYDLRSGNDK